MAAAALADGTLIAITAVAAVAHHLRWCKLRNLRASTIEQRGRALTRLGRWAGTEHVELLTENQLTDWYVALADRVEPESRATELSHIRQFYRWLQRERLRDDDPSVRLERPRVGRRVPRPVSEADLRFALERSPDRYRPWLVLAAYSGLRAMEIAHLRREDVLDGQDPPVLVVMSGKGDKDRVVPLSPLVIHTLKMIEGPRRGLVFGTLDSRPMTGANLSVTTNRYLHAIGLDVTLHQFRHRFGTRLYAECGDLRVVQELMGHGSPKTTALYTAYSEPAAVMAVNAIAA